MTAEGGRVARAKDWFENLSSLGKVLTVVGSVVAALVGLGTTTHKGLQWYLSDRAFAADVKAQQQTVEGLSRIVLSDLVRRLNLEVRSLEELERAGRLSARDRAYLDDLREQRDQAREELKRIGPRR